MLLIGYSTCFIDFYGYYIVFVQEIYIIRKVRALKVARPTTLLCAATYALLKMLPVAWTIHTTDLTMFIFNGNTVFIFYKIFIEILSHIEEQTEVQEYVGYTHDERQRLTWAMTDGKVQLPAYNGNDCQSGMRFLNPLLKK